MIDNDDDRPSMTLRDLTLDATQALEAAGTDEAFRMDEDAFRGFYDRTARMLWAYLYRLTGDRHAADDLLQETYYRFLRADVALDSEPHRRHYLFRIATNLARDGHRRRQTQPVQVVPEDLTTIADAATGRAEAVHERLDLTRALGRLRVRERALLWLAYGQGASHEEIAAAVGVKTASVKALLYRARRRLATLLGPRGRA